MSPGQITVTGVILAGGLARRMGGGDKGLIEFAGRPLITYALSAIRPLVDEIIINANRNRDKYLEFGYPVAADENRSFDGPLAGILSAMTRSKADYVLTLPCDSPLIDSTIAERMIAKMQAEPVDCLVADDGERLHPVVLMIDRRLEGDLRVYLNSGGRKIDKWFMRHCWKAVDFSDRPEVFRNVNTPEELADLEREKSFPGKTEC